MPQTIHKMHSSHKLKALSYQTILYSSDMTTLFLGFSFWTDDSGRQSRGLRYTDRTSKEGSVDVTPVSLDKDEEGSRIHLVLNGHPQEQN